MDLSWCIICDRHCIDNNLYCSESCRFQDNADHLQHPKTSKPNDKSDMFKSTPSLVSPPTSPVLGPFLYSFQNSYDRRRSAGTMMHATATISTHTNYQYYPYQFIPSSPSESSLFADDT
ncbi:hypothetical protein [Parasitella parasitica]|uniref:Uncharacterized protein n=1 Tax=Parasitella parasitica TaxID=35722 RepID=A0A0B7NP36_9FUNG|nr:hypothetical protein [Parasitella parasitica]